MGKPVKRNTGKGKNSKGKKQVKEKTINGKISKTDKTSKTGLLFLAISILEI